MIKCFFIIVTLYCLSYLSQGVCNLISFLKDIISLCSTHMSAKTGVRATNQSPEFRNGQLSYHPWTMLDTKILTACSCDKDVNKERKWH